MRQKVIDRLKELLHEQGVVGSIELMSFKAPTTDVEIDALTDEQLIECLELNGIFEG